MADKKLIFSVTKKDLKIDTFFSGGPGCQNQNKRKTGVRITHPESGAVGTSRKHRSQLDNKTQALKSLSETTKFKVWVKMKVAFITDYVDKEVENMMKSEHLKIETKDENGNWIEDNTTI